MMGLEELGHAVHCAENGRRHPKITPRNLEANGIVVDHRHATTPLVQLRSKRTAPATEQNNIRRAFEHPHHETHVVETRRPAGEDVTLLDALLHIETRTGSSFLCNRDLAVAAIESAENLHHWLPISSPDYRTPANSQWGRRRRSLRYQSNPPRPSQYEEPCTARRRRR